MPLYPWRCTECDQVTDTLRPVGDIEVPPDACDHCHGTTFSERLIFRPDQVKGFILSDTGYGWPSHGFYSQPYWPEKKR